MLESARALYVNSLGYLHLKRGLLGPEMWVPLGGYFRPLGRPALGILGLESLLAEPHKQHG